MELDDDLRVDVDGERARVEVALERSDVEHEVCTLHFLPHLVERVRTGVAASIQRMVLVQERFAHGCLEKSDVARLYQLADRRGHAEPAGTCVHENNRLLGLGESLGDLLDDVRGDVV